METLDSSPIAAWLPDIYDWVAMAHLLEDLRRDAVVPFLGAGVSQSIGYPGWDEAVLRLGQHAAPSQEFKPTTLSGDPLFLSDRFRQAIAEPAKYTEFFDRHFGLTDEIRDRIRASQTWRAIARLPCHSWITSNYDRALEFALTELAGRRTRSVDWADRPAINEYLLSNEQNRVDYCVHLHGLVPELAAPAGRQEPTFVFTEQEYQQRYLRSDEDRSKLFVVLTSRVVLFVGCSLTDQDLMGVLREVKAKLGFRGHRHYALLPAPGQEPSGQLMSRDRLRLKFGVEPIYFSNRDKSFAGLSAILDFLADARAADPASVLVPPEQILGRIEDDPQKGRWGMTPHRGPFDLSAHVSTLDGQWQRIDFVVTGPGRTAVFHLHEATFDPHVVATQFQVDRAVLSVHAWGAFTIGVEVEGPHDETCALELDLAECEDLPWDFRQR